MPERPLLFVAGCCQSELKRTLRHPGNRGLRSVNMRFCAQSALYLTGMVNAKFLLGSRYGFEMVDDASCNAHIGASYTLNEQRTGQLKIYAK